MGKQRVRQAEVLSERTRIPSDGRSSARVCVRLPDHEGPVELRLSRHGSFAPDNEVRSVTLTPENGEVNLAIYAPKRPGVSYLLGPGVKQKIEFVPANHFQGIVFDWAPTLAIALGLALILRSYAVASYYIPSSSMENTLMQGDLLIAEKYNYRLLKNEPRRGDIVIFLYPDKNPQDKKVDYIKRCIGLPGDKVEVRERIVFVNDQPLDEKYIKEPPVSDYGPVTVPSDSYFMMGDNRNRSFDSRYWGFVPKKNLQGHALFVFWPPRHMKPLPNGLQE